jgi:hypothetical protein
MLKLDKPPVALRRLKLWLHNRRVMRCAARLARQRTQAWKAAGG